MRRRRIRRRVTTMLWGGMFCRHLQSSANFVAVNDAVEVHVRVFKVLTNVEISLSCYKLL